MKNLISIFLLLITVQAYSQEKVFVPGNFSKIIVSPHIAVEFVEGKEQKVEVIEISEPLSKFNVDIKNKTLHLYLDDAKITSKSKKIKDNNWNYSSSIYQGTVAKVKVTYTNIESLDLRGSQDFYFSTPIKQSKLKLAIYGETQVDIDNVNLEDLQVNIYGESVLNIKKGKVESQKITAYGDSQINTSSVKSEFTKITTYGEGVYKLFVTDELKVTAIGESTIRYNGNPSIKKQLVVGEVSIRQMDM